MITVGKDLFKEKTHCQSFSGRRLNQIFVYAKVKELSLKTSYITNSDKDHFSQLIFNLSK